VSWSECLENWQHNAAYREVFSALLRDAPFAAFFWETPAITHATVGRDFEFALIDSPELIGVSADPMAFREYFRAATPDTSVVTFPNLGDDAWLVAPCPAASTVGYPHIASFARSASEHQQHAFWQAVGSAMQTHISAQPTWLSTSGLGVYWLHARLDSRPKYYTFQPYRTFRIDT